MTQWEKMLAAELNDLSLIPQAYMVKTENLFLWITLVYNSVSLSFSLFLPFQTASLDWLYWYNLCVHVWPGLNFIGAGGAIVTLGQDWQTMSQIWFSIWFLLIKFY